MLVSKPIWVRICLHGEDQARIRLRHLLERHHHRVNGSVVPYFGAELCLGRVQFVIERSPFRVPRLQPLNPPLKVGDYGID